VSDSPKWRTPFARTAALRVATFLGGAVTGVVASAFVFDD
jgi:hypothetical protein